MIRNTCKPERLDAAAELICIKEQLGTPTFRAAVASWLQLNAATTRRIMADAATKATYPPLPEVVAIVEAIEQA